MAAIEDLFGYEDADDPSDENLDDLSVSQKALSASVVYNTDWTVETIVNQVAKGALDLSPRFQRRDAWSVPKKSLLIESILLNFPVPPLTLAERGATKTYIVVDGKQRLNTLSQFFGLMPHSKNNNFKLTGLQQLPELNGSDVEGLRANFASQMILLENYSIRTNVIRGWRSDELLYSIFLRLNSGSVKLSPQELRQALKPGPFSEFLADYTEDSPALREIFPGPEPDFRMRDLELMNRYLGFQFFISEYRGDLKRFLDFTTEVLNRTWDVERPVIIARAEVFEAAYKAVVQVFGPSTAFRKWTGDKWENRLNRAVFDVMLFYLRNDDNMQRFVAGGQDVVERFKGLCADSPEFRNSIEVTTKSVDAVYTRLSVWGEALRDLGIITTRTTFDGASIIYG